MPTATTFRKLAIETQTRQRMKYRVHVAWHLTNCPECKAKREDEERATSLGMVIPANPNPHPKAH